ncbi:hypothetical protein Tco_0220206, partial [Tanacetum coccineum]
MANNENECSQSKDVYQTLTMSQEHACEEEVPLNNNIGKQSGDLIKMPSEAVEQGMDDHVPDEIDGAKCEQLPIMLLRK